MAIIWKAKVQKQQITSLGPSLATGHRVVGAVRTRAVPAAAEPVVAPVQYRPPTAHKIMQTKVCATVMMVRRPSLSVDNDQSRTARRFTQLDQYQHRDA